ncbi:ABC transporter permease [Tissierella sp.]|uniref:ABC transporter permease n=1 Tax=Tissierella sp. TaxID=41274 RepID=UPI0028567400|nr:ABC transporter permease [Tissierella sp.]MDR7857740.1 ABC transporter permease [Tissierella sp.]
MLRKIALSSMKGRKKDTFILSSVIILSFIFIVITTVFHASSEKTKYEQKSAMFGKWDLVYYNGHLDIQNSLLELEDVEKLGVSRIIGRSLTCGIVGTINQELVDLGSFHIYEGRMPEGDDEIALELNQLKQFPSDIKVGDVIPVRIDIPIFEGDEINAMKEQMARILPTLQEIEANQEPKGALNIVEIYDKYAIKNIRNTQSLEAFDGTEVGVKTGFAYMYTRLDEDELVDDPEATKENTTKYGTMINQKAYIVRFMTVTGIFQTYSNLWDSGQYSVANAFITEHTGRQLIEKGYFLTKELDTSNYETAYHLFINTKLSPEKFYNTYSDDFEKLRVNSYLHSDIEGSTENILVYGILLSVFVATIFIVFLIYFTQMKRRTRRIALLKSIGATNDQIGKLLLWEVLYILIMTIPIGVAGGIGVGRIVLLITNKYGKTQLNFHVDYGLTLLGVLIGILAIFISMIAPMIMSMKIPLTGTISEPPRRKSILMKFKNDKSKSKDLNPKKSAVKANGKIKPVNFHMKIQTFGKISLKNIKHNKGKHLLTLGLYTITITVLLGCVFLSFLFFGDYINNIIITGKPSYGFEVNYGLTRDEIMNFTEDINSIEGVTNVDLFKGGEHAFLWYEGIENNVIHNGFRNILPSYLSKEHFGLNSTDYSNLNKDNDYLVKEAIVTNIYGIDVNESIYNEFKDSITEGSLNKAEFEAGEEVILMLPIYGELGSDLEEVDQYYEKDILSNTEQKNRVRKLLEYKNLYGMTYDFRKSNYYLQESSIEIGDSIYLTIPTEKEINDVTFNDVKIAALIYYFPEKGIWPFSDTIESPVVIGSYNLIERLYPTTITGKGRLDARNLYDRIKTLTPTRYGKTWIFVETNSKSFEAQLQTSLQKRARDWEFKLHDYKETNDIVYRKAFNFTLIIAILGIAVAIINSIILYNTSLSKLEQERDRIGIFQALGVTKEQFQKQYLIMGFSYGLISLLISHIVLIIAVMFTSIGNSRPMLMNISQYIDYVIKGQLWLYPWIIHISICIVFFIAAILTYYLPLKKILDNQPIDNIRSLGR